MTPARFPLVPRPRKRSGDRPTVAADVSLTLELGPVRFAVTGRLDPTAAVSVLPHKLGLQLGATWTGHTVAIRLPGRERSFRAAPLIVPGSVGPLAPTPLFFAWAASNRVPLVLGQQGFLDRFDVCFHHARAHVEVRPADRSGP